MSRFQIAVIGDVHLGPNARQVQRLAALAQITAAGHLLEDLGAWFWVGDLFHAASRPDDRNALAAIVMSQADVAPVVILRGNHDHDGELEIFGGLRGHYPIHVCETAQVLALELATGDRMALGVFPWPSEAALVAAGVPVAGIKDAARRALEPLFLGMGDELTREAMAGRPVAWIGHATITGAIASNGQPQVGTGIELDGELLAHLGRDVPKLLGHIHKPQALADASAHYVGSICRLDFGEVERKRWIVLEGRRLISTPQSRAAGETNWRYELHDQPLEVAGLWHVEARLDDFADENDGRALCWTVTAGPREDPAEDMVAETPATWEGQEVRVRLRYPVALRANVEGWTNELRETFKAAARLELELVAIPDAGLRAPAVAAAETLEGKVRAWADASGTVLPGPLAEALELLTHSPAEAVLEDVAANVAELLKEGPIHAA